MKDKHRVFVAINLPPEIKKELAGYENKWNDVPAKWTPVDNLHITLVFLGDITDEELGEVCVTVKQITENHASFTLNLKKIAYGPADKIPPRYIWAGGETSEELSELKNNLEDALAEKVRFLVDKKTFSPHITLAGIIEWQWRGIEPEERPEVNENIDLVFTIDSIEVMESELKREGPFYTILESFELKS